MWVVFTQLRHEITVPTCNTVCDFCFVSPLLPPFLLKGQLGCFSSFILRSLSVQNVHFTYVLYFWKSLQYGIWSLGLFVRLCNAKAYWKTKQTNSWSRFMSIQICLSFVNIEKQWQSRDVGFIHYLYGYWIKNKLCFTVGIYVTKHLQQHLERTVSGDKKLFVSDIWLAQPSRCTSLLNKLVIAGELCNGVICKTRYVFWKL